MPLIRPVTDLRNKFADISKILQEKAEPIFLTKNDHGHMVVMSIESYEKMSMDNMIYEKLKEAIIVAESSGVRYDFDQVSKEMREKLIEKL